MTLNDTKRGFGIRDKIGYLFGNLGNDFTFILSSSFLLKFYTDIMNISAATVGVVMMLARLLDAVTDITMGRICDRARPTARGKFRPWILRMCIPVSVASFLIYQTRFATAPYGFRLAWFIITYLLWGSIFYTSINIPYGSMASVISDDAKDRQSLSTYRSLGSTFAGVIVGAGIPILAYEKRTVAGVELTEMVGERFTLIAGIFSILAIISYVICYVLTTERITYDTPHRESFSPKALVREAFTNRAIISVIVASVVMLLSQFTLQQMANYVYPDYYANTSAQAVSVLAMLVGMLISAALAKPLVGKFGKAETCAASSIIAAILSIILFFLRPESVWVYVGFNFFAWLGLGVFTMVSWAIITDVIDYSEIKNGIREDGTIYALYSFARKLGQAAAAGLSGLLLSLIGYQKVEGVPPSEKTLNGIFDISTIVPAIGFLLLAIILWTWYPLNKETVDRNIRILKERRSAK